MRTILSIMLVSLMAAGCRLVSSKASESENLTATFSLTDTSGQPDTTFQSGQQFVMSFSLTNTTGNAITYMSSSIPPVHFQVWRNDTLIAGSVYALSNAFVSIPDTLAPGQTMQEQCEAPTSLVAAPPAQGKVTLAPGQYQAKVTYPGFSGAQVSCTSTIRFSVVQ